MGRYGALKGQGSDCQELLPARWTDPVRLDIPVPMQVPSRLATLLWTCWAREQEWASTGIFCSRGRSCVARQQVVLAETGPVHGVSRRDRVISAVPWSGAAGLRAGTDTGRGMSASEGMG